MISGLKNPPELSFTPKLTHFGLKMITVEHGSYDHGWYDNMDGTFFLRSGQNPIYLMHFTTVNRTILPWFVQQHGWSDIFLRVPTSFLPRLTRHFLLKREKVYQFICGIWQYATVFGSFFPKFSSTVLICVSMWLCLA